VYLGLLEASGALAEGPPSALLAPRPGACTGGKAPGLVAAPVGLEGELPGVLVSGEIVGASISRAEAALRPRVLGGPHSPDGRRWVLPSSRGLWVAGGDRAELWQVKNPHALGDCAVSNGAKRAACVAGSAVRLFAR
jgi:hypothetical protein